MIRPIKLQLWFLVLTCLSARLCLNAVVGAEAISPAASDPLDPSKLDSFFRSESMKPGVAGFSVAVISNGKVVLSKGYGRRSLDPAAEVTPQTMFAIGSVSKQFTCAAILLLAEEGRLNIQDKVSKYFPRLTRSEEITLLDLMNHTSGYRDYYPLDFVDRRMLTAEPVDEIIQRHAGGALDFDPGTRWSYSNTGYLILGRVVEKITGLSFGEFLKNRIFGPLEMGYTVYEPGTNDVRLATGYASFARSPLQRPPLESQGWLAAAGAIYSTAGDMALWNLALLNGRLLKPGSFETMTRSRVLSGGRNTEYGCGLGVRHQNGFQILTHSGAVSGFSAWNAMVPSRRNAAVVLVNRENGLQGMPSRLLEWMVQEAPFIPRVNGPKPAELAKTLFLELQSGRVDRKRYAEEFNWFLEESRIRDASSRLKRLGRPKSVDQLSVGERGGLEVSTCRINFSRESVKTLMYRRPDGIVEQFFVD